MTGCWPIRASPPPELQEVQVDGSGFIFVPYAGRIKASGNKPERLRQIITEKLDAQTPTRRCSSPAWPAMAPRFRWSAALPQQGVFPIERPTRTLSAR